MGDRAVELLHDYLVLEEAPYSYARIQLHPSREIFSGWQVIIGASLLAIKSNRTGCDKVVPSPIVPRCASTFPNQQFYINTTLELQDKSGHFSGVDSTSCCYNMSWESRKGFEGVSISERVLTTRLKTKLFWLDHVECSGLHEYDNNIRQRLRP